MLLLSMPRLGLGKFQASLSIVGLLSFERITTFPPDNLTYTDNGQPKPH
jgi:hypothetical protein